MTQTCIRILSTRPLDPQLAAEASDQGVLLESLSFIETIPIKNDELEREIKSLAAKKITAVFTSMSAVDAVKNVFFNGRRPAEQQGDDPQMKDARTSERQPAWSIFCIGSATRDHVARYFGESSIAGVADSAAELAEIIIAHRPQEVEAGAEVVFFCGDQRRNELPARLLEANIRLRELYVYHTQATPHVIREAYNAIVFFSPSAVDSFFSANRVSPATLLFAIGHTTAEAIQRHTDNQVYISNSQNKESLIRQAIDHFINNPSRKSS